MSCICVAPVKLLIQPLIISYNNPVALRSCLEGLNALSYPFKPPAVLDNCSPTETQGLIHNMAIEYNCKLITAPDNLGWGASINYALDCCWGELQLDSCILLVLAHDCLFLRFDPEEIFHYFADPTAIFVCPSYLKPVTSHYNVLKSYYSRPGSSKGRIKIGHQTAFFARPSLLRQVRFDEQFWLYLGEYEIFTRARQAGFHSYQTQNNIVVNPSTDSSSDSCFLAYKLNSLYCAYKRHWWPGFALRAIVILGNVLALWFAGQRSMARQLANCLLFTMANPGCGLLAYRSSAAHIQKYRIPSLILP